MMLRRGVSGCFAAELGYQLTVVKDTMADYSDEMMRAALNINLPNYASVIVNSAEIVNSISVLHDDVRAVA